jgi:hypothetical protein
VASGGGGGVEACRVWTEQRGWEGNNTSGFGDVVGQREGEGLCRAVDSGRVLKLNGANVFTPEGCRTCDADGPFPPSSTFMVMSTHVIPRRVSCRGLGVGGGVGDLPPIGRRIFPNNPLQVPITE